MVFRGYKQHAVGSTQLLAKSAVGRWWRVAVDVFVVQRQITDFDDVKLQSGWGQLGECQRGLAVDGLFSQTADQHGNGMNLAHENIRHLVEEGLGIEQKPDLDDVGATQFPLNTASAWIIFFNKANSPINQWSTSLDGFVNQQLYSVSEVTEQMASVLVGQFHARDAEGRVYPVHEFQESQPDEAQDGQPVITYRLAIGDRVKHLGGEDFQLVQSGVKITRTPT
ncbi:hypothetical protein ALQ28_04087 [Pseudomonas syringae pv. delphinii]|nr:Uncharacterized protein ALO72_04789 [Pseudomonas syringae pv. delphinii]RMP15794.1 hypothetical protein ALQ28_04087 [Pseudomonas syringae pv. delphinii]RMP18654.1 hypothetical protein ALQ27_03664 [Pseudomonas syringae pv. delphinii]